MKLLLVLLSLFSLFSSFGQSRELTLEIQNIEIQNLESIDSIKIELTNQGFFRMGEELRLPVKKVNGKSSVLQRLNIQSDSTSLKIYFNIHDFIEIDDLDNLETDTLRISNFTLYPYCEQKGTWNTMTIFENDAEGETDFLNYETESSCVFDLSETDCAVPDSMILTINEREYISELRKHRNPGLVRMGHGDKRKLWIGEKRYFHFETVELFLNRRANIKLKKREPGKE
ncbi:hypothetical protein [Croceimicrobium hydrocarbonivorans]|uniref:Uncharacterized protein n=1 Tax=Croceimicrobium hydrocarbonivorans TaxID=2761580 RepID=A0A7H0VFP1_9FLAO|nr:hypothetical protein [Croceimicrobium hydrocarbonivorans]QNR24539.1 hypothetical protein H4K34_01480 [Croceimicrobium hydrocarbonivorans]